MKIVILDGHTTCANDLSWAPIEALGELTVYDRTAPEDVVERIGDADIVLTNKTGITADTISKVPNLKMIGVLATGFNIVDAEAATAKGIAICNVPEYSATSVAEFVFALLLERCHHITAHDASVKRGDWQNSIDFMYAVSPLSELAGKTIGLIGFGKIGKRVAEIAKAFGMIVNVYHRNTAVGSVDNGVNFMSLDQVLQSSDIVSLHIPLTKDTTKLINKQAIDKMKDGALIVNTARGGIIDETAVSDALKTGKLSALLADVVSVEPIKADNPLLTAPNVTLTPHIAWATYEARTRLVGTVAENIKSFMNGNIQNKVN